MIVQFTCDVCDACYLYLCLGLWTRPNLVHAYQRVRGCCCVDRGLGTRRRGLWPVGGGRLRRRGVWSASRGRRCPSRTLVLRPSRCWPLPRRLEHAWVVVFGTVHGVRRAVRFSPCPWIWIWIGTWALPLRRGGCSTRGLECAGRSWCGLGDWRVEMRDPRGHRCRRCVPSPWTWGRACQDVCSSSKRTKLQVQVQLQLQLQSQSQVGAKAAYRQRASRGCSWARQCGHSDPLPQPLRNSATPCSYST